MGKEANVGHLDKYFRMIIKEQYVIVSIKSYSMRIEGLIGINAEEFEFEIHDRRNAIEIIFKGYVYLFDADDNCIKSRSEATAPRNDNFIIGDIFGYPVFLDVDGGHCFVTDPNDGAELCSGTYTACSKCMANRMNNILE